MAKDRFEILDEESNNILNSAPIVNQDKTKEKKRVEIKDFRVDIFEAIEKEYGKRSVSQYIKRVVYQQAKIDGLID